MVVLCAWLFDIALSAMVNVARFDLGFYAGRLYGLSAASFVLAVLLIDNVALQAQMSRLLETMRRQAASDRDHHASANGCSAPWSNPPTTPSSPRRWTAPSPAGTRPPNGCSDSPPTRPSATHRSHRASRRRDEINEMLGRSPRRACRAFRNGARAQGRQPVRRLDRLSPIKSASGRSSAPPRSCATSAKANGRNRR